MSIAAEDPASADALILQAELSAVLLALTGDTGQQSFDPADVRGERGVFLVARDPNGLLLGCGALRPLGAADSATAEIKRMLARSRSRTGAVGVGSALLAALEARARALAYTRIALSTRRVNERALRFYQARGYVECVPFGRYADRPESVCLDRVLSQAAGPVPGAR